MQKPVKLKITLAPLTGRNFYPMSFFNRFRLNKYFRFLLIKIPTVYGSPKRYSQHQQNFSQKQFYHGFHTKNKFSTIHNPTSTLYDSQFNSKTASLNTNIGCQELAIVDGAEATPSSRQSIIKNIIFYIFCHLLCIWFYLLSIAFSLQYIILCFRNHCLDLVFYQAPNFIWAD